MFTTILCLTMAIQGMSNEEALKRYIVKEIVSSYRVSKIDAWIIADAVIKNSKRYNVPREIILSVLAAESAFNKDAISPKGAVGAMQVMPKTAEDIARRLNVKEYDISDLRTNIRFGTAYLSQMFKRYNDYELAIRAYNCGPGRVDRVIAGRARDYPQETIDYHSKISSFVLDKWTSGSLDI